MNESSNPGWVITMPNDGDFSPISFQDNYLFLEVGFFSFLFKSCTISTSSLQPFSDEGFDRQWPCVIQAHKTCLNTYYNAKPSLRSSNAYPTSVDLPSLTFSAGVRVRVPIAWERRSGFSFPDGQS